MIKKTILFYLLTLPFTIFGQKTTTKSHVLKPLDWQIIECGRPLSGLKEKCQLTLTNSTDRSLQGYRLTWNGQLKKASSMKINSKVSIEWKLNSNDVWVILDTLDNVIGGYKLKPGHNKIVIDSILLNNSRKLKRQITDSRLLGTSSGGFRTKEQEAYDVLKYELDLEVFPRDKYIKGANMITALALAEINQFVFDLDTLLQINQVSIKSKNEFIEVPHMFSDGKYWVTLPSTIKKDQSFTVRINYEGNPRASTNAPYKGGFSWNTTNDCQPWIATSCQIDGADLWFPCKDYQWDEADSVNLSFTVPTGLSAISNGVLVDSINHQNGTTTFNWSVVNPINNYSIALNIAPYKYISDNYISVTGESIDLGYWVLPENIERAKTFYPYSKKYLHFLETHLGPYPFRNEKLGIVEVPFVGMEHQTIIAFGLNYELQYPEYNKTLFHEICHEWFGNLVTASDWSSFWIHESFVGYMELLYEESTFGEDAYWSRVKRFQRFIRNKIPLTPEGTPNSRDVYNGDSYSKGTFLLHSIRYLIGKEKLLQVIRLMAYLDKDMESKTDGTQCRFTSTKEFLNILETISGQNFEWFENVYFNNVGLPILEISEHPNGVKFHWKTFKDNQFNMPLEIKTIDGIFKIEFENNRSECKISKNDIIEIDPNNWILKEVRWLK